MKRLHPALAPAGRLAVALMAAAALGNTATNAAAQTDALLSASGQAPHPAVVRVVVPEGAATSYGSGTLVDVRDNYGLVITNWHVLRDATGEISVVFPDGFRSGARALKVDADWDLAALLIWRPRVRPVRLAAAAPRPGDLLTIAGYGQGTYRQATGRCTQYLAPGANFPSEMVELDVEARQGDSGGPIFNQRGDLAGVLFGAGRGTTTGSYAGRVGGFLASVVPDLGAGTAAQIAVAPSGETRDSASAMATRTRRLQPPWQQSPAGSASLRDGPSGQDIATSRQFANRAASGSPAVAALSAQEHRSNLPAAVPADPTDDHPVLTWRDVAGATPFDQIKSVLAAIGILAIVFLLMRPTK